MRRWTLRITICLILGAITTVAVACGWSLATITTDGRPFQPEFESWVDFKRYTDRSWPALIPSDFSIREFATRHELGWAATRIEAWAADEMSYLRCEIRRGGWPFLSMRGEWCWDDSQWRPQNVQVKRLLLLNSFRHETRMALPLRPIWPGFLIDTLFYAAIWFGVFFGFTSAKRFIRAKRGRCPHCGYDLRGQLAAGCPECGGGRGEPLHA